MKNRGLVFVVGLAFSGAASAAVTYNDNGEGFVGKGNVQSLYDWNNATFQREAASLQFRLLSSTSATWECEGVNPAGRTVRQTMGFESSAIDASVNYDARRNNVGQITGFRLNGIDTTELSDLTSVGTCNTLSNWQVQPTFVEDSLIYEGTGEPLLQVSIDGADWRDLPITDL